MNTTTIGKVTVNLIDCEKSENNDSFKNDLLNIVRNFSTVEYPSIIDSKLSYDYLYHLSEMRGNIVRWLPIKQGDRILELGAECGAITGALLKLTDNVTAIVNCATDAEILAERFSNCKGLSVFEGDFKAVFENISGSFDWIIVKDSNEFKAVKSLLSPSGRIVFITDNRCGMKYFAGVKANGSDEFFSGIEGKTDSGFTYSGLRNLLSVCGYTKAQFFYPYPDWRFVRNIFSDSRLPKVGELTDTLANYDKDRMLLFSEKEAFDASCEDGSFPYYSNAYLLIVGEPLNTEYVRFSNDRAPEFSIYTTIDNIEGTHIVKKYPISEAANGHIRNIADYYKRLKERYSGSNLSINRCNLLDSSDSVSVSFEYVNGTELSKLMDTCLQNDDLEGFYNLFDKYVALTGYNDENSDISDIDIVFSNILVDGDDWTLIDYEWCKEGRIPVKETAFRAIYCYLTEDRNREKFNLDLIREKLALSKEASDDIAADESAFQKRVTGRNYSLRELRDMMGVKAVDPINVNSVSNVSEGIYQIRIYPKSDSSEFSETTAFSIENAYKSQNEAEAVIDIKKEDTVVRVDPLNAPCIVTIREAMLGEYEFPVESKKYLYCNGKRLSERSFVFSTEDPNLYFELNGFLNGEDTFLFLKLEVTLLSRETALAVEKSVKKIF